MIPPESYDLDLGHNHYLLFTKWSPDRNLNPQYDEIPDNDKIGALVYHLTPKGKECCGSIFFDCIQAKMAFPGKAVWAVHLWNPLTISPSLLCSCGDHGFIENGKWRNA